MRHRLRASSPPPSPAARPALGLDLSTALLAAYLALLPLLGGYFDDPRVGVLRLLLLGAAAARLLEARRPGGVPWAARPALPVVLFGSWALVTAFTGASVWVSSHSLLFLGTGILTYLLVADAIRKTGARDWLFGGIIAGAGVTGAWALREYLSYKDPSWRAFATFQGPNLLASYLLPSLLVGLSGIVTGRRPWLIAVAAATLLCGIGLTLTGSRGAVLLALPAAFVVWLILSHLARPIGDPEALRAQRLRLAAILCGAALLAAFFMKPTTARVGSSATVGEANSTRFRSLTWRGTLDLIRWRPLLGWGPGLWETAYPRYARAGATKAAHNGYLQTAAEIGLPGLALWIWVLVYGVGGPKRDPWEAGRTAALVAAMLHNGVDYGWLLFAPAMLTWALIGARMPAAAPTTETTRNGREPLNTSEIPGDQDSLDSLPATPMAKRADSPMRAANHGRPSHPKRPASAQRKETPSVSDRVQHSDRRYATGSHPLPGEGPGERSFLVIAILLTTLGLLPAFAELKGQEADAALQAGDPVDARSALIAAAAADPTDSGWERQLGTIALHAMNDPKAAIAYYEVAIRRDPLRASLRYQLAIAYQLSGDREAAIHSLEDAIRLDPNGTPPLMALAGIEEGRGHHDKAMALYRRVAAVQESEVGRVKALAEMEDANYVLARQKLADDAMRRGDRAEALQHIDAGLESAMTYLDGLKTWKPVLEVEGRYKPEEVEQVRAAQAQLGEWKSQLQRG